MTAADIAVIPSDDEAPYYFDVIAAAYEGMSEDEILADVLDAIIPAYLTQGPDGYPAEMFEGMLAPEARNRILCLRHRLRCREGGTYLGAADVQILDDGAYGRSA